MSVLGGGGRYYGAVQADGHTRLHQGDVNIHNLWHVGI